LKKPIKILIVFLVIILLLILVFRIIKVHDIVLKIIYPKKYSEYVEKYAVEYDVDKNLIYAIIKAESNFDSSIVSDSGAIGLMQIMGTTAEEIARRMGIEYNTEMLYNPDYNIMLGTKYYTDLIKEYDGNEAMALVAYNAGKGTLSGWIEAGIIKENGENLENIPYRETNNYIRKILRDYEVYKDLYK
jgi:soluble lytic murein transglycosylase